MSIEKFGNLTVGRIDWLTKLGLYETVVIESGHSDMIVKQSSNHVHFIIPSTASNSVGDNMMDMDYVYWVVDFR